MSFALAKKYQMKIDVWLALGAVAKSRNEVDFVSFNADAWVEDPELEQMSKRILRPGTAINLHKNIGRNDPCYCGSGRKYKKCHGG
jgi:preprotein translocase subunit SecA